MVSGMVSPECQEKEGDELALLGQCVGRMTELTAEEYVGCDAESALTLVLRNWGPWELLHPAEPSGCMGSRRQLCVRRHCKGGPKAMGLLGGKGHQVFFTGLCISDMLYVAQSVQRFINSTVSIVLDAEKSKTKVPADFVSTEAPILVFG